MTTEKDARGVRRVLDFGCDVGTSLLETSLAVLLIAVVAIASIAYFGNNTGDLWDQVPASFQQNNPGGNAGGGSGGNTGGSGGSGGSGTVCPPGSTDPVCQVP